MADKLLKGQRSALLLMTTAVRSSSTVCLPVVAGIYPLDIAVQRRIARTALRKRRPAMMCGAPIPVLSDGDFGDREIVRNAFRRIDELALSAWQTRWVGASKGRQTFLFFPSVRYRMRSRWIEPNRGTSDFMTGHGRFRARQFSFGLIDDASCPCGHSLQDADHVLWSCEGMDLEREELYRALRGPRQGPLSHIDLVASKHNYRAFSIFANAFVTKTRPGGFYYFDL